MSYKEIYELSNELYAERLELVEERIEQIVREPAIEPAFADYFRSVAQCINTIKTIVKIKNLTIYSIHSLIKKITRKAMPTRHMP